MVPNGWKLKKLNDVFKVIDSLHQTPTFSDTGLPMVRVTDVKGGILNLSNTVKVSEKVFSEYTKKYTPKKHDIVFSRVGSYGISSYVDSNEPFCLGQNTVIAESNDNAVSKYIFNVLKSTYVKRQIERTVDGSSHKTVSLKVIRALDIPIPPLPEQRKIAKILSTWDKAIATTEKLIETSQQQKKALMQQLLTGKKRLLNPDTGMVFDGDWEEVKLGDLATYRRGSFPQPYGNPEWIDEISGYPFIQVFDIDKNMKLKNTTKTKISDAAIGKSVFIKSGTVIVSLQGSIGRVAITQYDAYVDRTVLLFQEYKRDMNLIYFAYAIQELFEIEKEKAPGGTIKTITKQVLSNFTIQVPVYIEQQKIASVLTAADKEIELLQAKLAHLKDEKKALMQQLLTGKKRVKVDTTEAA